MASQDMDIFDIAVVGAGGAGTMAFLRGVLNRDRSVLITGDAETTRKGRATWVAEVDNIPGMHDLKKPITSTSRSTLKWIQAQPELEGFHATRKGKATAIRRVELAGGEAGFELEITPPKGEVETIRARYVVNATGIMDKQPHIDGSIKPILPFANRYDALYCIRCDGHKTIGKRLSVITNSGTGVHIAAILTERYDHEHVDILWNGAEPELDETARELIGAYGMTTHAAPITGIRGDASRDGEGLEGYELEGGAFVETNCTIVALGIIAYNQLARDLDAELDGNGRIVVSPKYESSVEGFFAVGDLVPNRKMQVYTAWDEAVDAADEINRRLRMRRRAERIAAWKASR